MRKNTFGGMHSKNWRFPLIRQGSYCDAGQHAMRW
jgi:hypothetical protein